MTEGIAETTPAPTAGEPQSNADVERLNAALTKERELRKEAERAAKEGKTAQARLEEIEAANASEVDKAIKTAVAEATKAERARTAGILAAAEARALAAGRFENPVTTVKLLDLTGVSVTDDGTVDSDAVKSLLDGLAETDPYLLKKEAPPVPTPGQAGIGVSGGTVGRDPRSADLAQIEADLATAKRSR